MTAGCSSMKRAFMLLLLSVFFVGAVSAADQWRAAGVTLYNQRSYRAALTQFENSLRADSDNATATYYQGLCYQQLGDLRRAKQVYRTVCRRFAGTPEAQMAGTFLKRVDGESSGQATSTTDVAISAGAAFASVRSTAGSDPDWQPLPSEAKIPFTRSTGRHLFVDAQVNGRPMKVIFDTGAEVCLFGSSHLAQAGLAASSYGPAVTVAGVGGAAQARTVVVTVIVGPIKRTMPVLVQDDLPLLCFWARHFSKGSSTALTIKADLSPLASAAALV